MPLFGILKRQIEPLSLFKQFMIGPSQIKPRFGADIRSQLADLEFLLMVGLEHGIQKIGIILPILKKNSTRFLRMVDLIQKQLLRPGKIEIGCKLIKLGDVSMFESMAQEPIAIV